MSRSSDPTSGARSAAGPSASVPSPRSTSTSASRGTSRAALGFGAATWSGSSLAPWIASTPTGRGPTAPRATASGR
ncbi:hypothetical protein MUK42_01299 [Musa troglodytarum]|uniref:Uncharacterized protein n=1 Tax=Musa troglodytarum TaxID=320322 RepID=A0A9E7JT00_9LILI|nr:hypothetical protein MUK42_01299 [Musa troglodytarum]